MAIKPVIEYAEFDRCDFRVGRVIQAVAPEWSQKLLQLVVDFGPKIGERTILSGVKQWYDPAEFIGNSYVFVINLAERKMGEAVSQGMMIMADGPDRPTVIPVPAMIAPGTVVR